VKISTSVIGATGILFVVAAAEQSGAAETLVPHRAVYDLELDAASDRASIGSMYGRMVYEFSGSQCDGYTVGFRFVTQLDTGRSTRLTDQQTTTYEDLEKGVFRFLTRSFVNQQLDREVRGTARMEEDSITVSLKQPQPEDLTLAPAEFPTAQMISLIQKAKQGERFFQSWLFDGSDEGRTVMLTTSVIGAPKVAERSPGEIAATGELAELPTWPVTMAYFDETENNDGTPIYRISFQLYENGVTRDLTMDYGDFALKGTLADLQLFEPEACQ